MTIFDDFLSSINSGVSPTQCVERVHARQQEENREDLKSVYDSLVIGQSIINTFAKSVFLYCIDARNATDCAGIFEAFQKKDIQVLPQVKKGTLVLHDHPIGHDYKGLIKGFPALVDSNPALRNLITEKLAPVYVMQKINQQIESPKQRSTFSKGMNKIISMLRKCFLLDDATASRLVSLVTSTKTLTNTGVNSKGESEQSIRKKKDQQYEFYLGNENTIIRKFSQKNPAQLYTEMVAMSCDDSKKSTAWRKDCSQIITTRGNNDVVATVFMYQLKILCYMTCGGVLGMRGRNFTTLQHSRISVKEHGLLINFDTFKVGSAQVSSSSVNASARTVNHFGKRDCQVYLVESKTLEKDPILHIGLFYVFMGLYHMEYFDDAAKGKFFSTKGIPFFVDKKIRFDKEELYHDGLLVKKVCDTESDKVLRKMRVMLDMAAIVSGFDEGFGEKKMHFFRFFLSTSMQSSDMDIDQESRAARLCWSARSIEQKHYTAHSQKTLRDKTGFVLAGRHSSVDPAHPVFARDIPINHDMVLALVPTGCHEDDLFVYLASIVHKCMALNSIPSYMAAFLIKHAYSKSFSKAQLDVEFGTIKLAVRERAKAYSKLSNKRVADMTVTELQCEVKHSRRKQRSTAGAFPAGAFPAAPAPAAFDSAFASTTHHTIEARVQDMIDIVRSKEKKHGVMPMTYPRSCALVLLRDLLPLMRKTNRLWPNVATSDGKAVRAFVMYGVHFLLGISFERKPAAQRASSHLKASREVKIKNLHDMEKMVKTQFRYKLEDLLSQK